LYVLKPKGIKKSVKIFIIVVVSIFLLMITPAILLQISSVQNFVVNRVAVELSEHHQTRISVGSVRYRFFNTLRLNQLLIEDQSGDTLLQAISIDANFSFWQLFRQKVSVTALTLDQVYIHLQKMEDGTMNFSFLINTEHQRKDSSFINLKIEKLKIKDSRLDFTNNISKRTWPAFDPGCMSFRAINAEMSIAAFNSDTINATLRNLSTEESSGLKLEKVSFEVEGSHTNATISNFRLELPQSAINLKSISLKGDNLMEVLEMRPGVSIDIPQTSIRLALDDLKAIVPGLAGSREVASINTSISGRLSNLKIQDFRVEYGQSFKLEASLDISGLPNLQESFIYARVNTLELNHTDLQDLISRIQNRPFMLSDEIRRLGLISYQGNITGFLSDLVAYGMVKTNLGNISSDISLRFENQLQDVFYDGTLRTTRFNLKRFLASDQLGTIRMRMNTKGSKRSNEPLKGTMTATVDQLIFNEYSYTNAQFKGDYDGTGFNGNITIKDENIDADFTGILDFRNPGLPVFDFDLMILNTNLHALNLIKQFPESRLSFHGTTNLTGNSLDNMNGFLKIEDVVFKYQNDSITSERIIFNSRTSTNYTNVSIQSDYLNGSVSGDFKYSTVGNTFRMVLARYLPSLAENDNSKKYIPNNVDIDLKLVETDDIMRVLQLPYYLGGMATVRGNINESTDKIELRATIDALSTRKQHFENFSINLSNNDKKQLALTGRAQLYNHKNEVQNIALSANALKDQLDARIIWQNNDALTNAGEINTRTLFSNENDQLVFRSRIMPTEIIISDSIWNLRSSEIRYRENEGLNIRNFVFESQSQYIHIDGLASNNPSDSLLITMNDLNLDYLMQLIKLRGISIGGLITGDLLIYSTFKEPILLADVYIEDLSLNDSVVGNGTIRTNWNQEMRQLDIHGDIRKGDEINVAQLGGSYTPYMDSLDLQINAARFSVAFLNRYFEGVASNFGGFAAGQFRIFGPTIDLRFTGDLMVNQGKATIDILQTTYSFNDRVILTPYNIAIGSLTLYDSENNRARAQGNIGHDGSFDKMTYDVSIFTDNLMVMNTSSLDDEFFYGRAYASGLARIFGDFSETNIVVNAVSRPKTKCYLSMAGSSSVLEGDFIRFESKRTTPLYTSNNEPEQRNRLQAVSPYNLKTDIQLEITPEAEIEIMVDPRAGDRITGRGQGNLRIRFDSFSDLELFGTVELEQGNYLFTLQTVIRKEFRINRGSTISWTGNPFEAQVNINGYYPLTASLTDLLEPGELQQITTRSTVPVHCLLYLTDDLMSPTIRFGIDLPASDESVKSRVNNIVNTEEMMNRQILYLLLFHKFFTPDYMRTSPAVGVNEGLSFAAATFSSQVNNWIQSTLNTNVFSFGVDWQKTNVESDEVKAQILIQPNNRLVINGNIGYRNDNISENKFIGDFDLEYKLNESGKLRFTAYNHTIDRAQLREAKTTQGVGLIYREDFNNVKEMMEYYWSLFKAIFDKKEENELTQLEQN
jgi:hypothetical protein